MIGCPYQCIVNTTNVKLLPDIKISIITSAMQKVHIQIEKFALHRYVQNATDHRKKVALDEYNLSKILPALKILCEKF